MFYCFNCLTGVSRCFPVKLWTTVGVDHFIHFHVIRNFTRGSSGLMCFSLHHITFTSLHVNIHYYCHKRSAVYPNANHSDINQKHCQNSSGQNTIRQNWHLSQPLKQASQVWEDYYIQSFLMNMHVLSNEYLWIFIMCRCRVFSVSVCWVKVHSFSDRFKKAVNNHL